MRPLFSIFLLLLTVGQTSCATHVYSLSPDGSRVQIVEYLNPEDRLKLQEVTMIKCELGMNARTQEANVESCHNEMRNKAAEVGGVVVLLEAEKQEVGKTSTNPFIYGEQCPNCITLRGIIFKPKSNELD